MLIFGFFGRENRHCSLIREELTRMDRDRLDAQQPPPQQGRMKRELTSDERKQIVSRLLTEAQQGGDVGKFPRGTITAVAADFHVCRKTITNIWTRAQENYADPTLRQYQASPRKKRNCGRKKKWDPEAIMEAIKEIPLFRRRTIRDLAAALGIPKSTLFDLKNDKTTRKLCFAQLRCDLS